MPLSKVKFNSKHEYEYVANYKVLQNVFDKHKIDNAIPVERLIKCKFQDNLEFLQWMKKYFSISFFLSPFHVAHLFSCRFWDQYYPGGAYDAVGRRGGKAGDVSVRSSTTVKPSTPTTGIKKSLSNTSFGAPANKAARTATRAGALSPSRDRTAEIEAEYQKALQDMQQQIMEAKVTVEQVEKEREFYFSKLREIEIYVQQQLEANPGPDTESMLSHISAIMYKVRLLHFRNRWGHISY